LVSPKVKVDPTAYVDNRAEVSDGCIIESNAKILGEVSLGKNVWVFPNTIIYGPVEIGEGSFLDYNCVIGHPAAHELLDIFKTRSLDSKLIGGAPIKIGKKVVVRGNCTLYSGVVIDENVRFGHNVLIREGVTIGENSLIGTNVVIDGQCCIGRNVSIQTGAYISAYSIVEDFVFLAPNCCLLNDKYLSRKKFKLIGPIVKKGASIGGNATLFPGVIVEEGAVVGAGAVVTKSVPSKTIVVGIPAKVLKPVPRNWKIPK